MDVTCNRCGTTYEFEEALISTTGTTVKCTHCGHLFKVRRRTLASSERRLDGEGEAARELRWRVRRADGSTHLLESLSDLTALITAGQFTRDDEISRTGQVWKKLGDIHELTTLFESGGRPRRTTVEPPPAPPPPLPASASLPPVPPPDAPRARHRSPPERIQPKPADQPGSLPGREPATSLADEEPTPEPGPLRPGVDPLPTTPPAAATPPPPAQTPGRPSEPEDPTTEVPTAESAPADEGLAPAPRRAGSWLVVGLSLLIAAGGAAILWWPRAEPEVKPEDHPAREFLASGDEALAAHVPGRFQDAIAAYEKALAFYPDDAHILSSLSRVYAVWSELLRLRMAAQRDAGTASPAELASLQTEVRRLAEFAKQYAERAAQRNPGNEEASIALSDAARLSGNLVAARAELDLARATEGVAKAETLRVASLLAIDEAGGDLRAGRALAEQSVAREPTLLRARLLLARCLVADGDFEGARMHLDAAASFAGAGHPVIDEVRATVALAETRARKAAEAAVAKPDAGAAVQPQAPVAKGAEGSGTGRSPGKGTEASKGIKSVGSATETEQGSDPAELVKRGEAALEQGAVPAAQRLFERALELDPGMPRARTGLGYVALERGQARLAVNHFRPAARAGNPEALIGLGDAYRRLNRARDALAAYKQYLKQYPRGENSSIAQRQIELLGEQLAAEP